MACVGGCFFVWGVWYCKNYVKICTHITLTYVYIFILYYWYHNWTNSKTVAVCAGLCVCWCPFAEKCVEKNERFSYNILSQQNPFSYICVRALLRALDVGVVCLCVRVCVGMMGRGVYVWVLWWVRDYYFNFIATALRCFACVQTVHGNCLGPRFFCCGVLYCVLVGWVGLACLSAGQLCIYNIQMREPSLWQV